MAKLFVQIGKVPTAQIPFCRVVVDVVTFSVQTYLTLFVTGSFVVTANYSANKQIKGTNKAWLFCSCLAYFSQNFISPLFGR